MAQSDYLLRSDCPVEQLVWLVNGTLSTVEREAVEAHVALCSFCQHEVAELTGLRVALQDVANRTPAPRADLFVSIERQIEHLPSPLNRFQIWLSLLLRRFWHAAVVCGDYCYVQTHLIQLDLLWMPLLLIPLVALVVYVPPSWGQSTSSAAFLAALFTALGMALLYGRESDDMREMLQATPTSPHLMLGVRSSLVFGYDLLLNCGLILPFLSWQQMVTPEWFFNNWLAPLCCLSALAFLLSVLINTNIAVLVCLVLWLLRLPNVLFSEQKPWLQSYEHFWHQGPLLFACALLAFILVFIVLARKEHFA